MTSKVSDSLNPFLLLRGAARPPPISRMAARTIPPVIFWRLRLKAVSRDRSQTILIRRGTPLEKR